MQRPVQEVHAETYQACPAFQRTTELLVTDSSEKVAQAGAVVEALEPATLVEIEKTMVCSA